MSAGVSAYRQADNSAAALSLVQHVAPLLFGTDGSEHDDMPKLVFNTVETTVASPSSPKREIEARPAGVVAVSLCVCWRIVV